MRRLNWIIPLLLMVACTGTDSAPDVEKPLATTKSPAEQSSLKINSDLGYAAQTTDQNSELALDVFGGDEDRVQPVVILLHGGGGSKNHPVMVEMSEHLAAAGVVVFNATYLARPATPESLLAENGRGMRAAQEAVACVVHYARQHAAAYGGDPDNITIVGQSAGGFFGLLHALSGGQGDQWADFAARGGPEPQIGCSAAGGDGVVEGFVGFNGAYFIFDVAPAETDPALKALTNPEAVADRNPALALRLILGEQDHTQPEWHFEKVAAFAADLQAAGHDAAVVRVDAGHAFSFDEPALGETLAAVLAVTGR